MIKAVIALSHWLSERAAWLRKKTGKPTFSRRALSAHAPEQTLTDAIRSKGFDSCIAYAKSAPLLPIRELAERLGGQEWVLHTRLLIESERAQSVEWYARSLFIRYLHEPPRPDEYFGVIGPSWTVDLALYRTALTLPRKYRVPCIRVALGFARAEIGFNWKPRHTEDIALRELFATYWPESSVAFFAPMARLESSRLPKLHLDIDDSAVVNKVGDSDDVSDDDDYPGPHRAA